MRELTINIYCTAPSTNVYPVDWSLLEDGDYEMTTTLTTDEITNTEVDASAFIISSPNFMQRTFLHANGVNGIPLAFSNSNYNPLTGATYGFNTVSPVRIVKRPNGQSISIIFSSALDGSQTVDDDNIPNCILGLNFKAV
jgi:hypothetical protein